MEMRKNILKAVFVAVFILDFSIAFAQKRTIITGTVTDTDNQPVIGAVVTIDGFMGIGTSTDANGKYSISASDVGTLRVQCIGYIDQTAKITRAAVYDFVLKEDSKQLDEAIVVGYGTVKESDLTGAVSQINMENVDAGRFSSVDQMLSGRAAGVQVKTTSGQPGASVSIKIRGNSSFNGDNEPLYVVDGVILNSSNTNESVLSKADGLVEEESSGLLGLNPQDIESIEILKDASATAIYGALGANGVVLITTKMAVKEKPQIFFSAGIDISNPSKKIEVLDLPGYCEYLTAKGYKSSLREIMVDPDDASAGYKVQAVDWQDYMMRTAINQRYYFSVSNRKKSTAYMFSVGYKDVQGILKNTDMNQLSTRLNLDQNITDKFKVGIKFNFARIHSDMLQGASSGGIGSTTSAIRNMLNSRPYLQDDDEDIDDRTEDLGARPDRWLRDYVGMRDEYRVIPNIYADVQITKWLKFKSLAGADYRIKKGTKWKGPYVTFNTQWGHAGIGTTQQLYYNLDNMLMFNKSFNKHNLSGTVGVSYSGSSNLSENRQGWNIEQFHAQYYGINSADLDKTSFSYSESKATTLSFLTRFIYNYRDRYVLTATYRCDGSSRFSRENRFAHFPSFAAAWNINKERWFKVRDISTFKVRLGWGRVGKQAVSPYQTMANYNSTYYPDHSEGNEKGGIIGVVPANLANPSLKWETTQQANAGIDLKFLKNRYSITVDVYDKNTFDLLQSVSIPSTAGFDKMWMNMGTINNRGIEMSFDAQIISKRKIKWDLYGNISHNRNKIISIGLPSSDGEAPYFLGETIGTGDYCQTPVNIFVEGQAMGLFYGIKTDGIVQIGETGPGLALGQKAEPGAVKYVDVDGNGFIDLQDRQIIGDPNPDFTYGFGTSLSLYNFTFDLQFTGVYGNDIANINLIQENDVSHIGMNIRTKAFRNAWTPECPNNEYPALDKYTIAENKLFTSRCIEDGSFLRLESVSLGYNVPIKRKTNIVKSLNVSLSGNNLFVFTKYSGWDPDVNVYGSNILKYGCDNGSYPRAWSVSLDLKIKF